MIKVNITHKARNWQRVSPNVLARGGQRVCMVWISSKGNARQAQIREHARRPMVCARQEYRYHTRQRMRSYSVVKYTKETRELNVNLQFSFGKTCCKGYCWKDWHNLNMIVFINSIISMLSVLSFIIILCPWSQETLARMFRWEGWRYPQLTSNISCLHPSGLL